MPAAESNAVVVAMLVRSAELSEAVKEAPRGGCRVIACLTPHDLYTAGKSGGADLLVYEAGMVPGAARHEIVRVLNDAKCPVLVLLRGMGAAPRELLGVVSGGERDHIEYVVGLPAETVDAVRRIVGRQQWQSVLATILAALLPIVPEGLVDLMVYIAILAHGDATVPLLSAATGLSERAIERRFSAFGVSANYCLRAIQVAVALYRRLEAGWKTRAVVEAGLFSDESSLTHAIKSYSGKSARDWRWSGGFPPALDAIVLRIRQRAEECHVARSGSAQGE